ncbi:hypothetical protein [Lunatibacter salilacus]|uniref:hypothetical protein n=1 Tax=Lunatibacter salilacus TaxID=2483804 RepID=UPI00131C4251|nr:hypothetical protein [Lunatibacter salilacus]
MKIIYGILFLAALAACSNDNEDITIQQAEGNVWRSGGLMFCADQLHLDNGDTLVVSLEDIHSFISGDKISVTYQETGVNESCPKFTNCKIIEIRKVE